MDKNKCRLNKRLKTSSSTHIVITTALPEEVERVLYAERSVDGAVEEWADE